MTLNGPAPLDRSQHDLTKFRCRHDSLNAWLQRLALKAEGFSARTYVVCAGAQVVGYYSLATAGIQRDQLPSAIRRNMPDPVPAMLLGRLAVDGTFEKRGIGSGLLKDAMLRTLQASQIAGVRTLLVHAIHDEARAFYAARGFVEFPLGSSTLFLPIETIARGSAE